jgi:cysteinyl-tRNA synthetase
MVLRFYLLQSHYRSTTEFKKEAIDAAGVGYEKLLLSYQKLSQLVGAQSTNTLTEAELQHPLVVQFIQEMNDDINTPRGIAILYELARETNSLLTTENSDLEKLRALYHIWNVLGGNILGILPASDSLVQASNESEKKTLDIVLKKIIAWRKEARDRKDFQLSDSMRNDLAEAGVIIEDSKEGTNWSLK